MTWQEVILAKISVYNYLHHHHHSSDILLILLKIKDQNQHKNVVCSACLSIQVIIELQKVIYFRTEFNVLRCKHFTYQYMPLSLMELTSE